ncbi:MAG: DNA mismatch repair protein MutS [Candidatus Pristimantibacillus lignocellulolyticus]|uniref:DNA mismatch repair protein MutS n=1 Tax=Candidatus Pristimantibacillus lignocellulolyticus TaxID=2994561 RepID=A0A9J6ZCR4_9BACL|nr:MAG: DNA mismatch repair protein MutS [Candidatus Pristimantibacillus lignocellulolyticus]
MATYTPMIQQYLSIKEGVQDAFLFFRLGDFYEMFFDDAILASRELEITLTGRDGGSAEKIPMCGVPYHAADNYIARLIEKGYKVAICEQVEDPAAAKGIVRREVVRTITPGTVMESKSLDGKQNNFIAAVVEQAGLFGLASSDLSTGEIYVTSFVGRIDSLMDEVNIYAPSELVGDQSLLTQLEQSNNWSKKVPLTPWEMCTEEMLAEQFSIEQLSELTGARRKAVRVLLSYLEDTQKRNLSHLKILHNYEPNQYMILDYHTRRNLELTETVRDRSKKGSLLWLLDRTQTAMGARLLRRWIDKPLLSAKGIEQRQSAVETLYLDMILREDIKRELAPIYDLERLVGRVAYGNANAKDVHALKLSLRRVPALVQLCEQSSSNVLQQLVGSVDPCDDLADLIDTVLIDDPPLSLREGGLIRDGYDDYLDKLREASKNGKVWLAELERKEREATGIRTLKIGFNKVFGYYLEISKANVANLPEGRYERKQTLANAERYVTPELKEKERLILEAEEKMVDLEYSKFIELREHLLEHLSRLQKVAAMIAELDVYQSLALVSAELRFVKPTITEQYDLHVVEGRHPVVELMMEGSSFIANATDLYRDDHSILLITGPNMAGKSTYMRQVALICIMAQIGCFVPAQSATIPLTDRIFTRIGAADDLIGGQSTFMVEMKDIQMMTEQATMSSLVIIDELGRGTSTGEGMAIAQAVIEYVHEHIGCKALVSTHFHELSHLSTSLSSLVNARMAVEESGDHVTFLRKLVPGAADTSYGIYCAQLAGLPDSIITRAYQLLDEELTVDTQTIRKGIVHGEATLSSDKLIVAESTSPIMEAQREAELSYAIASTAIATEVSNELPKASPHQDVVQLSIFEEATTEPVKPKLSSSEEQVVKQLKKLDLFNMTPMQAMNILNELKTKLH